MFNLQSKIGLEREELASLSEDDQNFIKSYLFLVESSNTTAIGALRLFSSNLYSDAYSLIRILYEIGCLLHWGNESKKNKEKLYYSIFKSDLPDEEHYLGEWKLIKDAQRLIEAKKPALVDIRRQLNNFGGHISRKKILQGNITNIGDSTASRLFTPNFRNKHLLAGLDFTYNMFCFILEEYSNHLTNYDAVPSSIGDEIGHVSYNFVKNIRPKLLAINNDGNN